jgi:putative heme-binding domain-containing protein
LQTTLAEQIIAQGDQNDDQRISADEFTKLTNAWYNRLDPNKTGDVRPDGFSVSFAQILQPPSNNQSEAGAVVGAGERGVGRQGARGRGQRGTLRGIRGGRGFGRLDNLDLFAAVDLNKDGALLRDELDRAFMDWFHQWDKTNAGALDQAALVAGLVDVLPAAPAGGRGRGGRGGAGLGGGNRLQAAIDAGADFSEKPPVIAKMPTEELALTQLQPGYKLELVVSEPHVQEPMAIAFDGNGRMYVLEMRTYMQDADATGELQPGSQISRHEDKDNDGVYETHSVFVDKLVIPRFVLPLDGNAVVTMDSNVDDAYKYTDTDGDGVADKKEFFATGLGRRGNIEHQQSSLFWALDNWMYSTVNPFRIRWTPSGEVLREETGSNGGQWGASQDNYGKVYIQDGASGVPNYFQLPILYGRFEIRDQLQPGFTTPYGITGLFDYESGYQMARPDGTLNQVTASSGSQIFRGDRLPADMVGDYFYGEPVARIVRRSRPVVTEGLTQLQNVYQSEHSEFIRSADSLFRPVEMKTAPDGTMYIVDTYRGIVQEGNWTRPGSYLRARIDQYGMASIVHHGRIWRVTHQGFERDRTQPRMLDQKPAELVPYLAHPNGWWRDTAQQILVQRQDRSVVPALVEMASRTDNQFGQIHAMWTLEGLGELPPELVRAKLSSNDPIIRVQAIRLSEALVKLGHKSIIEDVRRLASDPDANVSIQAMMTLNYWNVPHVENTLTLAATSTKQRGPREIADQILQRRANSGGGPQDIPVFSPADFTQQERFWLQRGALIYQSLCVTCHGRDGKGAPQPNGPEGSTMAPSLAGSARVQGHRAYVVNTLLNGLLGPIDGKDYPALMVPMGTNNDEWIAAAASFIRNSFGNSAAVITPADVAEVRAGSAGRNYPWTIDELASTLPGFLKYEPTWKVSASHNASRAHFGINSPGNATWNSLEPVARGMWFQVEFPEARFINELQIDSPAGFASGYQIQVSTDGQAWSEPIATGVGQGELTKIAFTPAQARLLRITVTDPADNAGAWAIQRTRLFEVLERKVDSAPRIGQLAIDEVLSKMDDTRGEVTAGRSLFTRLSCAACHTTDAEEPRKGPFLPEVTKAYSRRQLAEAILAPSKNILEGFKSQIFTTADGLTLQGFVTSETATSITLREVNANERTIAVADIDERRQVNQSAMPEGLASSLKVEEFASLLDYLQSIKSQ